MLANMPGNMAPGLHGSGNMPPGLHGAVDVSTHPRCAPAGLCSRIIGGRIEFSGGIGLPPVEWLAKGLIAVWSPNRWRAQ
eukprot:7171301-Pyramimonas_sp.AAC.2